MNKLLCCALLGVVAALLSGCGQPSQPAGGTPSGGVVSVKPAEPVEMVQVKAGVGSGKKGRSLDKHEGIIVTPAKTLFVAKEKIKFEIEIPYSVKLYEAEKGSDIKSHEEFMEKVIKANNIAMPELPEGHKYVYDPILKMLMVEKPAP